MGRYLSVYLGPYATCPVKETSFVRKMKACSSLVCPKAHPTDAWNNVSTAFCASCGSPVTEREITLPGKLSPYDALGDRENLSVIQPEGKKQQANWFIPNQRGPRDFRIEHEEDTLVDVCAMLKQGIPDTDMEWFQATFHKDLLLLRNAYDSLTLAWGLITYSR